MTARAPVRNSGLNPTTARRVAGIEPAKMTIPRKPCIQPILLCFMLKSHFSMIQLHAKWEALNRYNPVQF